MVGTPDPKPLEYMLPTVPVAGKVNSSLIPSSIQVQSVSILPDVPQIAYFFQILIHSNSLLGFFFLLKTGLRDYSLSVDKSLSLFSIACLVHFLWHTGTGALIYLVSLYGDIVEHLLLQEGIVTVITAATA